MATRSENLLEYNLLYLARLDLFLRREVLRMRSQLGQRPDESYRGLYVSDTEVDELLSSSYSMVTLLAEPMESNPELSNIDKALDALDKCIREIEANINMNGRGEKPRLVQLGEAFGLSRLELEIVLICLAAEFDLKYERLFAYLQDDNTKKRPTVNLLGRLLCPSIEEKLALRRCFEPESPLLKWDIVTLHDDPQARRPVLLARYLKLNERIASFLLGSDQLDSRLSFAQEESQPAGYLSHVLRQRLIEWGTAWRQTWLVQEPIVLFLGRYGSGTIEAAQTLARSLGRPLLLLNAAELAAGELNFKQALKLAEREAKLAGAVLAWSDVDRVLQTAPLEVQSRIFIQALARGGVPTFLHAGKMWEPAGSLGQRPFLRMEIPEPSYLERQAAWTAALNGSQAQVAGPQLEALVSRFRLTTGQITDALARASALAWQRDPANGHRPTLHEIEAACRMQAQPYLGSLARQLVPRYSWPDIVLPPAQLVTLEMIATTVRHRATVYGQWGFDRKLANGKGLIALFAGPSGTGKTMAAEIIANELELDLYRIDLSAVVNKYIGETEKNLERIFSEAQDSNAILFFDEADALFGKRTETKDAHDRYANIETAYLLQRTEEHSGLVILASNLKNNMDEAFVRRLHFAIDFPLPEEAERLEIWGRTFPPEAPRVDDLDLEFLARKFKFTGGNIRNVILAAAFLAADRNEPIAMGDLIRAVSYELQKMGKLIVESEFEHYFEYTLM